MPTPGAPCHATGSLSHYEENNSVYEHPVPMGRVAVEQHAKRQVNIVRYADGSAKATITASGSREIVQTIHSNGCEIVNISRSAWERVGPAQVPAILEFEVSPDDYRIRYSLPAEKTKELQTDTQSNSCGVLMANPPSETVELEWNPWSVTLHCPTEFPNHDGSMGCVASEPHDTGAADGALHQTVVNTSDIAPPARGSIARPCRSAAPTPARACRFT